MGRVGPWTEADRQDLVEAMGVLRHGQQDCAARLRQLGLKADQSSVSSWATGRTGHPRSATVVILRKYIDEALGSKPAQSERAGDAGAFDDAVQELADEPVNREPMFGSRQGALVDALTERLKHGPDLSESEAEISRELFRVLRMRGGQGQE